MTIQVTQFLRPNGRIRECTTEISDSCKLNYDQIIACGCRFTAEELTTGQVSLCIECNYGDFSQEITSNDQTVQKAIEKMINEFSIAEFLPWKHLAMLSQ